MSVTMFVCIVIMAICTVVMLIDGIITQYKFNQMLKRWRQEDEEKGE